MKKNHRSRYLLKRWVFKLVAISLILIISINSYCRTTGSHKVSEQKKGERANLLTDSHYQNRLMREHSVDIGWKGLDINIVSYLLSGGIVTFKIALFSLAKLLSPDSSPIVGDFDDFIWFISGWVILIEIISFFLSIGYPTLSWLAYTDKCSLRYDRSPADIRNTTKSSFLKSYSWTGVAILSRIAFYGVLYYILTESSY